MERTSSRFATESHRLYWTIILLILFYECAIYRKKIYRCEATTQNLLILLSGIFVTQ